MLRTTYVGVILDTFCMSLSAPSKSGRTPDGTPTTKKYEHRIRSFRVANQRAKLVLFDDLIPDIG